jgi:hypothetical protein
MTAPSPSWSIRRRGVESLVRLVAGLAALPAAAVPPTTGGGPAALPPVVHFSTTQRFAAQGLDSLQTVPFLAWLEEVAGRLERALGESLPAERGQPLVFVLGGDPAGTRAHIRREILSGSRGFGQVVRISNPERAEPAEVLAAAVSMMVARHVAARQPPDARDARPALAPDWFACGLAGSLYAVPRLVLQRRALDAWMREADPPLESILGPGPAASPFAPLAEWTTLVAWLRTRSDFADLAGWCMNAWAAGQTVDTGRLAARLNPAWTARDLAQQFDLAIAVARRSDVPWRMTAADLAARLREAIAPSRDRTPIVLPEDVADPIDIRVLIDRRHEPWARAVAHAMRMSIDQIPVGQDPALNRVVNAYRDILDPLRQPVAGHVPGWFGAWRLRRRLEAADREFDDLEALVAAGPEVPVPAAPRAAPDPAQGETRLETEAMRQIFHDGFRIAP